MTPSGAYDAVVVGSGPNGLAAAIRLAQAGLSVIVLEANEQIGGGTRTVELTEPGFLHDVCSAVMPFAEHSAALRSMPLTQFGLKWLYADVEVAHPLDEGDAGIIVHDVQHTADRLGRDSASYASLFGPLSRDADAIFEFAMGPMLRVPKHPFKLARFGLPALSSANRLANRFDEPTARALFAGLAGHAVQPFSSHMSASVGLALGVAAHAYRWAIPKGGAASVTTAMADYFTSLGGVIETACPVRAATDIPSSRLKLLSATPTAFASIFDLAEPKWVYGPGAFKVDWALNGPIPWADASVGQAATVHLGGSFEEIAAAELAVHSGDHPDRPYVLLAQPTNVDPSRAPAGKHIAWGYCHVPNGSDFDMVERIENQIERFAPGFRDLIIAKHIKNPAWYADYNENYVGGDIGAGAFTPMQMFGRPKLSPNPYSTSLEGVFLCGASTAPGGGVHGMAGWNAAHAALRSIGAPTGSVV